MALQLSSLRTSFALSITWIEAKKSVIYEGKKANFHIGLMNDATVGFERPESDSVLRAAAFAQQAEIQKTLPAFGIELYDATALVSTGRSGFDA